MSQRFELTYESTAGTYTLPLPWRRLRSVRVRRIEVPLSYYPFLGGSLVFTEDGGADCTAAVAAGTYDASSFASAVETAMGAASGLSRTYTLTYSTVTGGYVIAPSTGDVELLATSTATVLAALGFSGGTASAASLTSDRAALPVGALTHLVVTSTLARLLAYPGPLHATTTTRVPDELVVVPLKEDPYAILVWEPVDACPLAFQPDHAPVHTVSFSLYRDDTAGAVDLRGGTWSLTLEVVADL